MPVFFLDARLSLRHENRAARPLSGGASGQHGCTSVRCHLSMYAYAGFVKKSPRRRAKRRENRVQNPRFC